MREKWREKWREKVRGQFGNLVRGKWREKVREKVREKYKKGILFKQTKKTTKKLQLPVLLSGQFTYLVLEFFTPCLGVVAARGWWRWVLGVVRHRDFFWYI